jgi:hypothetical protein
MEIMYIPLLMNVAYPATCNFWTERDAMTVTTCGRPGPDEDIY